MAPNPNEKTGAARIKIPRLNREDETAANREIYYRRKAADRYPEGGPQLVGLKVLNSGCQAHRLF